MSILFTGGAGYIGSHCCYTFEDHGHKDIIVVDDLSTGCQSSLPKSVLFYQGDLRSEQFIEHIFKSNAINTVFHLAGSISPSDSFQYPIKYYENNVLSTWLLIRACAKYGVQNFIFSSTAAVYAPGEKVSEEAALLPNSPYATSKLMAEMAIQDFHKIHGLNYVILRYFNVAGADLNLRTGHRGKTGHLIEAVCKTYLGQNDYVTLLGTDYPTHDGTCIRDFIHVSDLSEAHFSVYQYMMKAQDIQQPVEAIFNCGCGRGYSVKTVLQIFEQMTEKPLPVKIAPRRLGDPAVLTADVSRLQDATGWVPTHSNLSDIIASSLEWAQKNYSDVRD